MNRSAVRDDDGRSNALTQHTVRAVKTNTPPPTGTGNFEITSVSIGNVQHGYLDGTGHASATIAGAMVITAKADGDAAGAQGNGWKIFGYDDRPGQTANLYEWDIRVGVDVANKAISYTIFQKPAAPGFEKLAKAAPNVGNLADKLAADDDFAAHFSLDFIRDTDGTATNSRSTDLGTTNPAGITFGATAETQGISSVGLIVRFNDTVEAFTTNGRTNLVSDLRRGTTAAGIIFTTVVDQTALYDNQVHQTHYARDMAGLPGRSGFRVIRAGIVTNYGDEENVRKILSSFRPDSSIRPRPPETSTVTLINSLEPTDTKAPSALRSTRLSHHRTAGKTKKEPRGSGPRGPSRRAPQTSLNAGSLPHSAFTSER